ncbi:MAG: DUF6504 family protein [Candidatus Nanopelagicales bacterium]|jgi:hypothetical protein
MRLRRSEVVAVWLKDGRPDRFIWNQNRYLVVEQISRWFEMTPWWAATDLAIANLGEQEIWRVVAKRVNSTTGGVFDLINFENNSQWYLSRVID